MAKLFAHIVCPFCLEKLTVTMIALLSFMYPINAFSQHINDCDSIPPLNRGVVEFTSAKIKKSVGRGECWDLAAEALNSVDAKWNGQYVFGREVDYENECVFPGDIIQMEKVTLKYAMNGGIVKEKMPHHTAVIYEVKSKGDYMLAHQNTSTFGRRVGLSGFNLAGLDKGKVIIYRPAK